jgi:hypothetical protein
MEKKNRRHMKNSRPATPLTLDSTFSSTLIACDSLQSASQIRVIALEDESEVKKLIFAKGKLWFLCYFPVLIRSR